MTRTTMSTLLLSLRGLTSAGSAEYTVNGSAYWTDAQLQDVLDRHVVQVRQEHLQAIPITESGGSVSYYDYQSKHRWLEDTSGGTSRFVVYDDTYAVVGSAAYTVDYPRGLVTFGTATTGLSRYLTSYSYDMDAAAADVWTQKAAHYVTAYDFSTDNHSMKRSQIISNCMQMAKEYSQNSAPMVVSMDRSDTPHVEHIEDY